LYIGSAQEAQDINWLNRRNIRYIINTAIEVPNYFPRRKEYLNLSIIDIPQEDILSGAEKAYRYYIKKRHQPGNFLIHCHMGISRSSSVVIYILMKLFRLNFRQARDYLRKIHPKTSPNIGFTSQLQKITMRYL
ncbi:MAG: dual specificity protein phosphatase family protein, partial [archaeon]